MKITSKQNIFRTRQQLAADRTSIEDFRNNEFDPGGLVVKANYLLLIIIFVIDFKAASHPMMCP